MSLLIVGRSGGEFVIANLSRKTKNAVCGVRDGIRSVRERSAIGPRRRLQYFVNHGRGSDCGLLALSTSSYSRLTPANVNVMVLVVLVISLGNNEAASALGVTLFESIRAPSRRVELGQYLHELDQQNTVALLVVAPGINACSAKDPEPRVSPTEAQIHLAGGLLAAVATVGAAKLVYHDVPTDNA